LLAVLTVLLALAAGCGDDDSDSDTASPTRNASEEPSGTGPTPTDGDGATPAGSQGAPAVCTQENAQQGTITTLDFDRPTGGGYEVGDGIEITLTIINCGDNNIELSFPTTQRYLFIAQDKDENEVWNSASGVTYDEEAGELIIAPNETVVYEETWDQKNNNGEQVAEGVYKISAFSIGCTSNQSNCRFGPIRQIEIGEGEES
jgi:hypothetical protein